MSSYDHDLIPELLELNRSDEYLPNVPVELLIQQKETISIR